MRNMSEQEIKQTENISISYLRQLEKDGLNFCIRPSSVCEAELEEWEEDPRSMFGAKAIKDARRFKGGWVPSWDDRTPYTEVLCANTERRNNG